MEYKITARHLGLEAIVYVRQSTATQVLNNQESQRVQYRLTERAEQLGWLKSHIVVVDQDLGVSASGNKRRAGFEYLQLRVCEQKVGAIFSVEASRLARNGREWHTLLEQCGMFGVLLIDRENTYDTRLSNDRLLLGLKGEMSAMELRYLRERSEVALAEKARRGELFTRAPIGYLRTRLGVRKDPDLRICEALELVFDKFDELGSINKVCIWFRDNGVELPAVSYEDGERGIRWKLPQVNTIHHILTNPIYSGVYAYGRSRTEIGIEDNKKVIHIKRCPDPSDWTILIKEHHEGWISWEKYLANQEIIKENANMKRPLVRGAVRNGKALLGGLLRCGHCGHKLMVAYNGRDGTCVTYRCRGISQRTGKKGCISFGAVRIEGTIEERIMEVISPLSIQASCRAIEIAQQRDSDIRRQLELALEQARYQVKQAKRSYSAVDSENRLVAAQLEKEWEEALNTAQDLETQLAQHTHAEVLSSAERDELVALAQDLPSIWSNSQDSSELKKRIIRLLIREIVVYLEEQLITAVIHWEGGQHSQFKVRHNKTGEHRFKDDANIVELISELARIMPDQQIAACLNRLGSRTSKHLTWTAARISSFRSNHDILVHKDCERLQRGDLTIDEVAELLAISKSSVWRLIRGKIIPAKQACAGAPWIVQKTTLESEVIQQAIKKRTSQTPLSPDSKQIVLYF